MDHYCTVRDSFHYVFIDGYWKVMYRTPEGWKMKALALALRRCPE
ncbi:hypothetical protein ACQFJF_003146 [Escherichia coli]